MNSMAEISDEQISDALRRGAQALAKEPRAKSARYDKVSRRISVELTNGCAFVFPPDAAQGLENATPSQLAQIEMLERDVNNLRSYFSVIAALNYNCD